VAGETGVEGYIPFHSFNIGQTSASSNSTFDESDVRKKLPVGPRPKYVAHCPTSFPNLPSERFYRINLGLAARTLSFNESYQRRLQEILPSLHDEDLFEHKETDVAWACSPLRSYRTDHLFYQVRIKRVAESECSQELRFTRNTSGQIALRMSMLMAILPLCYC